jgi:hypothetical protein
MLRLEVVDELLPQGKAKEELEQTLERADQAISEGKYAVYDLRSSALITNDLALAVKALGGPTGYGRHRGLPPDGGRFRSGTCIRSFETSFTASLARRCEMLSTMPRLTILKLKLPTQNGCSDCEFGMTERAFQPQSWRMVAPATLPGMQERATQIGAKLSIWSGVRAGTEIELSIAGAIAYGTSPGRSRFRLSQERDKV